jgi:triosephosphate isomerase
MKKLIVGNWKMYPQTLNEAKGIVGVLKKVVRKPGRAKVVICPPALFVAPLLTLVGKSPIAIGAQNTATSDEGACTGETSPSALVKLGARYTILGHSERRAFGETDALIAQKIIQAVRNKLQVIVCVGEHTRDDTGAYFTEVGAELRASLAGFPKSETKQLVIAYEPIWAIGAKALHAATPPDFREMSIFIRRTLVTQFGKTAGFAIPILYGGSVDERNAEGFLREGKADGFLVGRASLDPERFAAIIATASTFR